MGAQQFRPPLPVAPRPNLPPGMMPQQANPQMQPGMDNGMRMMLQQRQQQMPGAPNMGTATAQSPLLAQQLTGMAGQTGGQGQGQPKPGADADLLDKDIEENLGMNDDELFGDFGDDFNILEFADALDSNDTNKTNILDDLEAEETDDGAPVEKAVTGEAKPPPYGPGATPQDPSRGPPPPYPGQQKVRQFNRHGVRSLARVLKLYMCFMKRFQCLMQYLVYIFKYGDTNYFKN